MTLRLGIWFNQISLYHWLFKHHCQRLTYIYHSSIYHLLNTKHITPIPSGSIKSSFLRWCNLNEKCAHHDKILDHLIKTTGISCIKSESWEVRDILSLWRIMSSIILSLDHHEHNKWLVNTN